MNPLTQLAVLIAELHAEIYSLRAKVQELEQEKQEKTNGKK